MPPPSQIGGVIFGWARASAHPAYLTQHSNRLATPLGHVLYWGDAGYSGIQEPIRARKANRTEISLASPFYRKMIKLQKTRLRTGYLLEEAGNQPFLEELSTIAQEAPPAFDGPFCRSSVRANVFRRKSSP